MPNSTIRIATYARVSSDEQRDRRTVRNQHAALERRLCSEPGLHVFKHYEDDGVSGTIPLKDRPGGGALVRDARAGRFSQVWVVRADRLGRDELELFRIWNFFETLGIRLHATAREHRRTRSHSASRPSSPLKSAASSLNAPPRA